MISAPNDYKCPFCAVVKGIEGEFPYTKQSDIFYSDDFCVAFIASHWWPNNKGHVIVVPKEHYESIYDIPTDLLLHITKVVQKISKVVKKVYKCDGIHIRQNNEKAGGQDVWHFHTHIFPRYADDNLYLLDKEKSLSKPEYRVYFSNKLNGALL